MFGNNDGNDQQGFQFQSTPAPLTSPILSTPPLPLPLTGADTQAIPAMPPAPHPAVAAPHQAAPTNTGDDASLMAIKNDALANLTPLVGQIDQSPEEKFKTTMMLIQASDNAGLIKEAYSAANQITDSKARAQALIDVINEINYFTQKNDKKQQP
jgi:hypothetical protein